MKQLIEMLDLRMLLDERRHVVVCLNKVKTAWAMDLAELEASRKIIHELKNSHV